MRVKNHWEQGDGCYAAETSTVGGLRAAAVSVLGPELLP